ncbi:MAG TPA: cytochrome c oxidase assembly protein [Candidatus Limnocylindrales bacterium]|nr:cytochrome c oxidase assembly protein [Candidatus Limnocylindrales bacterium]
MRILARSAAPECRSRSRFATLIGVAGATLTAAFAVSPVLAHGPAPADPPTLQNLLLGWTFEPLPTLGILVALSWWTWAVRRVDTLHPANPVPRRRTLAFVGGMVAIAFALLSGIDQYDTTLFSIHMVQHVLLTLVAAPLIALSAPVTLMLRVASPATRKRWILPVLHSRVLRFLAFPVVSWVLFAAAMWVSHFSPLFDAALENPLVHDFEHAIYLFTALLFWWPAVALDPAPWRMSHPARALYVFLQMTQNTFLSVVILNAQTVLYPHYATVQRSWGPTPLEDQQIAAAFMWVVGDMLFLAASFAILLGWSRAETRAAERTDRRAAEEMAAIRVREARLAERLAREPGAADRAPDAQPGSGVSR